MIFYFQPHGTDSGEVGLGETVNDFEPEDTASGEVDLADRGREIEVDLGTMNFNLTSLESDDVHSL